MAGKPSTQFYPGDWWRSVDMRKCCMATQGIWINMLLIMWDEKEQGKIRGTKEEICRIIGCKFEELDRFFKDNNFHKFANVTFRNVKVTIINRRMYRAYKEREGTKKRVKKHREREKRKCNENVTLYSSTSSSIIEKNNKENCYIRIFETWNKYKGQSVQKNDKKITWHSHQLRQDGTISPEIIKAIKQALSGGHSVEDICGGISNYARVLLGEDYFWSYPWGLTEFLTRGEEKHKQAARKWWRFLPDNFIEEHYLTDAAKKKRINQSKGLTPYQKALGQERKDDA